MHCMLEKGIASIGKDVLHRFHGCGGSDCDREVNLNIKDLG